MLANKSVIEFLEETASKKPVPGGGSVAANSGATAAALVEMVANLTVGKKGYEDTYDIMEEIIEKAKRFRTELIHYIDKDSDAFNKVMKAFKLPKSTEDEKEIRKKAIQESTKTAAIIPLEVAKKSYEILALSEIVITKGNKNTITDGAVATMMARTAVLSALYNVKINLGSITDIDFVNDVTLQVEELEKSVIQKEKYILNQINL